MNTGETYKFVKNCAVCGTSFQAKRKGRLYCSRKCYQNKNSWRYLDPEPKDLHPLLQTRGNKRRRGEVRKCGYCEKEIYVLPTYVKKRRISFCSQKHMIAHKKEHAIQICVLCKVCSSPILTKPSNQKWRPRVTCSKECLKKHRREKAEQRRQTYTKHQVDRLARYSPETEIWRKAVFERDDYTCQMCGVRGSYLEADHIKPWAYYPELRFELTNGRTLCKGCHNTTKISWRKMKEIYGNKDSK